MRINIEAQRLCIDQNRFRGIPFYVLNIIKTFNSRGNDLSISFFDYKKERNNREKIENILHTSKVKMYECNSVNYKSMIEYWNDNSEGLDDTWNYEKALGCNADIYFFPHIAYLPYSVPEGKSIVTVHDMLPLYDEDTIKTFETGCRRFRNIIKYLEKREDIIIITDTEDAKRSILKYSDISEKRIRVVYCGYERNQMYHQECKEVLYELGIDSKYLLYLGALDMRKGLKTLCEAFYGSDVFKDLKLVLAGGHSSPEALSFLKNYDEAIITGFVTEEQKRILMSMTEAFIFPAYNEGFGVPVAEAMACGAPVIATNSSSLPEVGGDAALYFEPGNVGELRERILRVLNNQDLREKMIQKGYENSKRFSWDKTANALEKEFKSMLK